MLRALFILLTFCPDYGKERKGLEYNGFFAMSPNIPLQHHVMFVYTVFGEYIIVDSRDFT